MKKVRRKPLLLLAFLMVLYIGPMILAPSFIIPSRQNEPNTVKDFSLADGEGWLTGWSDRKGITITGSSGAGTNYQIMIDVTYESEMETDFADIRFTDNNGVTLLDYWREDYTVSTSAVFWIKVSDDLDSDVVIYMYYGNSEATSLSNGTNTFILYEDWTTETIDLDKWDVVGGATATVTYSPTDAIHGNVQEIDVTSASQVYYIKTDLTSSPNDAIMGRLKISSLLADYQRMYFIAGDPASVPRSAIGAHPSNYYAFGYDNDGNLDSDVISSAYYDTYTVFQITRTNDTAKFYCDGNLVSTLDIDPTTVTQNALSLNVQDTEFDLFSDWLCTRKFIATEPVASFGIWNEVGEATFYFNVSFDMWGFDTGLIILGLVMIPVSGLYLAYGVKHDRSSDRLFYGLIIFLLGCGLFIGGILP